MPNDHRSDPTQAKIQYNLTMTWELREDIFTIAQRRNEPAAQLIRDAIEAHLEDDLSTLRTERVRDQTARNGSTT